MQEDTVERIYLRYEGYDEEYPNQIFTKYVSQPIESPIIKVGELRNGWMVVTEVLELTKDEFYYKTGKDR